MSALRIATTPDPAQWDQYVLEHPGGGTYLTLAWKEAVEKSYGHRTYYLTAFDGQIMRGALPLVLIKAPLTRGRLVSLPFCDYGGCLAEDEDSARQLVDHSLALAAQLHTGLEIRSRIPSSFLVGGDSRFQQITEKCRLVLELPASSAMLWAGFKSKLRSQINRAKKDGMTCRLGQSALLADFYQVFARNMRDLGSPVHARAWLLEVINAFDSRAVVGVVYKEGQPVAAGIVLAHGRSLTIPWASSLRAFSRMSPNMLLYWSMMEFAADNGFQVFDFGRSTPGEGTYAFKQQWGAQPVPLFWYRHIPVGKAVGQQMSGARSGSLRPILEKVWQLAPLAVVNTLGPLVRKYIDK